MEPNVSTKGPFLPSNPFPVLFVGSGNIVFGNDNVPWNHSLRIEKGLGARLNVVGIVDPSTDRVNHVLGQKRSSAAAMCYSRARHFLTLEEAKTALNGTPDHPSLIILATPPHLRGTMLPGRKLEEEVIEAFGTSPAIFCEKPVSTARPHASIPVIEFLRNSGNVMSIGYMLRYLKVVQKAMSIIRDNNLTVMAVNARYTCAYSKMRKTDWWNKAKQCGPIVEQATHFCDLCRYLGGEVVMYSVRAISLEHFEPPGKLSHMTPEITQANFETPDEDKIPRGTSAMWKFENGALGSLTHLVALHGMKYSNEIVVTADGYQLRLVDLYTVPTLYVRSPQSEQEEVITYQNDDPFFSEFAGLLHTVDNNVCPPEQDSGYHDDHNFIAVPRRILSTFADAWKTYEFTWRIRDESERSSESSNLTRSTRESLMLPVLRKLS